MIKASVPVPAQFAGGHPARRTFQALRIVVNDELAQLDAALPAAWEILRSGGRLAAISFHSLEDRRVKRFLGDRARGCVCPPEIPICVCGREPEAELLTRRAVAPTPGEVAANPRSKSAHLRVARKLEVSDMTPEGDPAQRTSHGRARQAGSGTAPGVRPAAEPAAPATAARSASRRRPVRRAACPGPPAAGWPPPPPPPPPPRAGAAAPRMNGGGVALPLPGLRPRRAPGRETPRRSRTGARGARAGVLLGARAARFIRALPDHRVLDRVVRGRAWILILGVMLAGIVAMQVEVLKLGASIGRSIEQSTALQSRNELLRASVASLSRRSADRADGRAAWGW